MRRTTKSLKNGAIYYGVMLVLGVLRRLPLRWLLALGRPLGVVAYGLASSERKRARRNIACAAREGGVDLDHDLTRQVFMQLGRSTVECLAGLHHGSCTPRPDLTFAGAGEADLRAAVGVGRGVVFASAHLGNWELVGALVARVGRLHVLARQSYDSRFTSMIERFRAANGLETIWVDRPGAVRAARKALRAGDIVGIMIDQPVRRGGCEVPFFGRLAPTSTLAAGLARSTGAALIVGYGIREANGCHRVWIEHLELARQGRREDLVRWTAEMTGRLERAVRRAPDQWLWTLDRW